MYNDPRDHVFTLYPYHDVVVDSARGVRLRDTNGREYLDLASGQLCTTLGHSHPRLVEVARNQAARVVNLGIRFFGSPALDACAEIASVCQAGLDKVALCSTGSEANELAVRMARAATGHHELVGIRKGYYGATHQMLSLSDYVGFMKGIGTRSAGIHRLVCPDCRRCPLGLEQGTCGTRCIHISAENIKNESTGDIAAFLVEPVLGSGGIIVPPKEYIRAVRKLCDHYGALLIADEAQTGLGRTGRWMGMEHFGVVPDICVVSKGLGAGFPVAAVVTSAEVEARCLRAPMANMSSHSFDPFGAAIAGEVIRTIRDEGLVKRAEEKGRHLRNRLGEIASRFDMLENVRGLGLMIGVDVVASGSGERDPLLSLALEAECLLQGLVVGYSSLSGVIRILPPLTITLEEIDRSMDIFNRSVAYLTDNGVDMSRYMPVHSGSAKLANAFLPKLTGG
jgi:2,2-dialkylglycine decarboxylase (pyruvate)